MSLVRTLAASLALAAVVAAHGEGRSFVRASTAPPPGFEDLAGPQTTEVDVHHAGRLLIVTLARFDHETLQFLEPQAVAAALDRLIDEAGVAEVLARPLATNAHLLCAHPAQTDCGELVPEVAGIIFDEGRFRVELFLNPLQVEARPVHLSKYLPAATATGTSSMHLVSVSVAGGGGERDGERFNAATTSIVARGDSRVLGRWDVGDEGLALNELSWQRDRGGWEYEAGLFRSFGRSVAFFDERDLFGVRVGRSLNTRADLDTAEGTPIFLFLNQRSRVDILRDDRLLDSRFYEGGNQQLDTSRLPDGAYRITVRVRGGDGRERDEEFFFVRTALLPPRDQPIYYAEAGAVSSTADRALPEVSGEPWLRLGAARRLHDDLGVEAALLHAGRTTSLEGGAFWFGPGWQLRANLMASSDGDSGAALVARVNLDAASIGLDYRHVRAGDPSAGGGFDPLEQGFTQGTLTLTAPAFGGRLSARARSDSRDDRPRSSGFGLSFSRPVYRRGPLTVDFDLDGSSQDDDRLLRLSLQARWRQDRRYGSLRPGIEMRRDAAGSAAEPLLDARTTVQRDSADFGRLTASAFALREVDRSSLGASVSSDSRLGRSGAEIEYVGQGGDRFLSYSANSRFGIVSQDRHVAFGGRRSDLAAVVIDIAGQDQAVRFDVLIDDQSAGEARAGVRTIVGLRPYQSYRVRLRPRGSALVEFDDLAHVVTLYPGNVQTLRFESRPVTVLVGQALWADGEPVARARFENVEGYGATDGDGWFQVEVSHDEPLTLDARDRGRCVLTPPAYETEQGLAVLEALPCEPIPAQP